MIQNQHTKHVQTHFHRCTVHNDGFGHNCKSYNIHYTSQLSNFDKHNYNTIIPPPLSAARDNSRQLAGGNARARSSGGIIGYNIFRFRDWKGCNVIRAHDTI